MRIFTGVLTALAMVVFTGCRDCATIQDDGNPDRMLRLVGGNGENLWFGDDAVYDPAEAEFVHESLGQLESQPDPASGSILVKFPETEDGQEDITLRVDSATSYNLRYNTLVYSRECEQIYELSFVKFQGEQICTVCGDTQFNDDEFITLRPD